jgi:hypothetical protein
VLDLILLGWPIQAMHAFTLCLRRAMKVRLVSTVFKSIVIFVSDGRGFLLPHCIIKGFPFLSYFHILGNGRTYGISGTVLVHE